MPLACHRPQVSESLARGTADQVREEEKALQMLPPAVKQQAREGQVSLRAAQASAPVRVVSWLAGTRGAAAVQELAQLGVFWPLAELVEVGAGGQVVAGGGRWWQVACAGLQQAGLGGWLPVRCLSDGPGPACERSAC
jgi:hypothetical protein